LIVQEVRWQTLGKLRRFRMNISGDESKARHGSQFRAALAFFVPQLTIKRGNFYLRHQLRKTPPDRVTLTIKQDQNGQGSSPCPRQQQNHL
jgi:hypothetical protein